MKSCHASVHQPQLYISRAGQYIFQTVWISSTIVESLEGLCSYTGESPSRHVSTPTVRFTCHAHSAAGISRSVTMTVMYIMTVSSLDFEESLTVVQFCREMANPNFGFRQQLRVYSETKLPEVRAHSCCAALRVEIVYI